MSDTKFVICGSIAMDRIMNFSGSYHELIEHTKLETLSVSVLVESLKVSRGGTGANIAYNLARLGDNPVLLGAVGSDGKDYIEDLNKIGVDTAYIHTSDLPTASFNVLTDSQDNQVGGFYPGAMGDAASLNFLTWAESEDVMVGISAHDPLAMRRQVKECRGNKIRLFYDPGQQVSNISGEDLQAGIEAAEIVIVNDYELTVLLQKTGLSQEELQSQVPILVSTHGRKGSVLSGKNVSTPITIDIAKPGSIVDPTGAGDAYRAGFLYGYLRQWELKNCGQLGATIASFVLEQQGTQIELSHQAIIERYKETFNEEITL